MSVVNQQKEVLLPNKCYYNNKKKSLNEVNVTD